MQQPYMRQSIQELLDFVHMCQHIQHTQLPKLYHCSNHNLLNLQDILPIVHHMKEQEHHLDNYNQYNPSHKVTLSQHN